MFYIFDKLNTTDMTSFYDYLAEPQPAEFECYECGEPIDHQGYCSGVCFEASML